MSFVTYVTPGSAVTVKLNQGDDRNAMSLTRTNITNSYFNITFFFVALMFLSIFAGPATASSEPQFQPGISNSYTVGVLAFRGEEKALKRWVPTAEYLNQQIPGSQFNILPLGLEELRLAVEKKQIYFLLTNTGHYVELEVFYGVSRIATVKNDIDGQVYTSFGAVIFTRADRADIKKLADLKGKRFEIEGKFTLSTEGDKIIATAERSS
jgi:ABC-type phosphate/phosphonate transport system substrate-binding protein